MSVENLSYSVNVGCGEQGLQWLNTRRPSQIYFGLDQRRLTTRHTNYVMAEATSLPIRDGSINTIYADYYFNPMGNGVIPDFMNNPQVLLGKKYAPQLGDWFRNDMHQDITLANQNLPQIRYILRSLALQELSRILTPNGTMTIVDKPFVNRWIAEQAENDSTLTVESVEVTSEDFDRSKSLRDLFVRDGEPTSKLLVKKLESKPTI